MGTLAYYEWSHAWFASDLDVIYCLDNGPRSFGGYTGYIL